MWKSSDGGDRQRENKMGKMLEEMGARSGKRVEMAGSGCGQTREGAREVNIRSIY